MDTQTANGICAAKTSLKAGPAPIAEFDEGFSSDGTHFAEAANAADLAKTLAVFTPFLKFNTRVTVPIQESAAISMEAAAWRDAH